MLYHLVIKFFLYYFIFPPAYALASPHQRDQEQGSSAKKIPLHFHLQWRGSSTDMGFPTALLFVFKHRYEAEHPGYTLETRLSSGQTEANFDSIFTDATEESRGQKQAVDLELSCTSLGSQFANSFEHPVMLASQVEDPVVFFEKFHLVGPKNNFSRLIPGHEGLMSAFSKIAQSSSFGALLSQGNYSASHLIERWVWNKGGQSLNNDYENNSFSARWLNIYSEKPEDLLLKAEKGFHNIDKNYYQITDAVSWDNFSKFENKKLQIYVDGLDPNNWPECLNPCFAKKRKNELENQNDMTVRDQRSALQALRLEQISENAPQLFKSDLSEQFITWLKGSEGSFLTDHYNVGANNHTNSKDEAFKQSPYLSIRRW